MFHDPVMAFADTRNTPTPPILWLLLVLGVNASLLLTLPYLLLQSLWATPV